MIRLVFSKKGLAKYISHLDMQRTMQRTLRRAGIPVWYSEGFNPHPYLCFASPLSVGIEGENEIIDFRLAEEMPFEEMKSRFNQAFPQGFTGQNYRFCGIYPKFSKRYAARIREILAKRQHSCFKKDKTRPKRN